MSRYWYSILKCPVIGTFTLLPIRFRIHSQTDAGRTAAGFVDKQVARVLRYKSRRHNPHTHYRKTEKNQVLHGDTSTLRTASSTQLTVQQYTEYNTVRTHDVFLERLTSLSIFICLLLIRKLYKYFIYGPEAHTKTSGNVRATVETQQLTVDRTAPYGVWSNSHTPTS